MTSTLTRHTTQPPGATNGSVNGSVSDSASDTTPSDIKLTILLPDGRTKTITVEYGKQMMDLIVQVAASNKLSPAGYTLIALNEDTGRPIPYQASQSIGSLGVTEVELISKKAEKERRSQPAVKPIPAFEKTQRLTVSLPRNQKFVTRVNYKDSLARVFQMVCHEKNLDPYKYELRHPTHPDEPLNMATPLIHYGIHEICVVSVSAQEARRAADFPTYDGTGYNVRGQRTTVTSSAATLPADMPRRKPENEAEPSYMPGMTEKKKKRGILGLFSKRKEGKFKLDGATYGDSSASGSSGTPSASSTMTRSVSSSVTPVNQMSVSTTIPRSQSQGAASFGAEVGGAGAASSSSGASSAAAKMPNKPPRTKRKAPAPPPPPGAAAATVAPTAKVSTSESLTVSVTNEQSKGHHSRNSSHSSGFDEANMSPLESPGNSSRESTKTQESAKTKTSIDASSIDSSEMVQKTAASSTSTLRADIPAPIAEATASLKRKKRKAPAPPPPPGAAASVSVTTPVEEDSDRFTPPPPPEEFASADGESQSDSCEITPPSGFRENGDEVVHSSGDEEEDSPDPVARTRDEIQAAVIDELKQDKPKGDPNEGIEDVVDLVEDALKYTKDGDSDASSVTSSVIEGVVSGNEPTSPKAHDVTNEIALPAESEPALLSHKLSKSESSPGHVTSNIDHVTTISVGGLEPRVERQESIEKARHASNREDPRLSMRMDEEITLGQEEIMYVDPEQPRSRSSSKGEAPTSPLRRSRVSSESSVVSEPNFGFEENVFTEDDIRRFENDYRMPKRNKDEIVEFKFGTLDRKAQLPTKKEEPKKQEQAPVTSLRSLRQAYTRQRPTLEESGMVELNKKPLFVYTGNDVDRKEQAALFEALNPNIQEMDVPKSPTVPKDDVELMRERRNSGSAASSPRHPSSPRRLTSFEEDTVLSPAEIVSPEPVFDSEKTTREETVTTRDHEAEQPMRQRIGSSGGGAAKPAGHSTSFVQSAIYREKSSRPGSTGQTDPMKRAGKTSIYDIIKADISQRKGGIHHHVTDTYDDVADETPASPESTANTSDSPAPGEMDYLEYDERSKRLSGGFTHHQEEVVLPKQQFFFSSTSVADEYTPPVTRSEAKIHKPSQLLMGPRPWGAHRGVSDPSAKDISVAVDDYNTKNGIGTDHNSNYTDSHSVRTTSSFHSENMTVPHSPVKSEQGPRSELGFSPRPESESDSILEEKSISMIALPTVESQSRARYGSSPGRRSSADENAQETGDSVVLAKQSNLKSTGNLSKDAINERYESSKSSLQNQYDKLQEQFQRWQHQLAENQELLSRKKILSSSTTETSQSTVGESSTPADKTRQELVAPSHAEPSNYTNRFSTRQHVTSHVDGPTTRLGSASASVQRGGSQSGDGGGDQENQSRLSSSSSSHSPTTSGTTHPRPHAFTPGSFTMGSSYTSRGLGSTGYSKYADSGLRHVEPPRGVLSSSSGSSSSTPGSTGSVTTRSSSGTGYSSGLYGSSSIGSAVTRSDEASVAVKSPTGRKSTSELYRQPMRNKGRSFGSQSSNESTGPPNKPSTNDLLSAKARLRKGSSEYATEISEGVAQPVESPPPPALPDSSPPKSLPPNTSLIYTDTPKEGSPGSRSSYSSGSTSSYRSITPTTPKPPPPPTAQPIKSALKQPSSSRGGRKDDPRFGPKLDPREELMIAIRSAGGRTALNKVPVNETKWYYNGD